MSMIVYSKIQQVLHQGDLACPLLKMVDLVMFQFGNSNCKNCYF